MGRLLDAVQATSQRLPGVGARILKRPVSRTKSGTSSPAHGSTFPLHDWHALLAGVRQHPVATFPDPPRTIHVSVDGTASPD